MKNFIKTLFEKCTGKIEYDEIYNCTLNTVIDLIEQYECEDITIDLGLKIDGDKYVFGKTYNNKITLYINSIFMYSNKNKLIFIYNVINTYLHEYYHSKHHYTENIVLYKKKDIKEDQANKFAFINSIKWLIKLFINKIK